MYKKMKIEHSPENLVKIKELYIKNKISLERIANCFNSSIYQVEKILKKQKIIIKPRIKYHLQFQKTDDEIIKMYNEGKSIFEIIKELKCSTITLRKFLKRKNIDLTQQCGCKLVRYQKPFYFYLGYTDITFIEKYNELFFKEKLYFHEIKKFFKCSNNSLRNAIKRFQLKTRNRSESRLFKKTNDNEILTLYKEYNSAEKIANICHINIKTVIACLKRNKIFISGSIKKYKLPSGKIIIIRGYEPQFLDYIFMKNILQENEIDYKPKSIEYINHKNILAKYYPDFYIPKWNLIVEIKSTWTLKQDKDVYLKENITKKSGFNYIRIINKNTHRDQLNFEEFEKFIKN